MTCSHLFPLFSPDKFQQTQERAIERCRELGKYSHIAVCGSSGLLLGGVVSATLNKYLVMVRKPNDLSHSSVPIECHNEVESFIILDDIIDQGNTVKFILTNIFRQFPNAEFCGVALWNMLQSSRTPVSIAHIIRDVQRYEYLNTRGERVKRPNIVTIKTGPCSIPECVSQAADLLDIKCPEWHTKIDIDALDMKDSTKCILGQLFGTCWMGYEKLFGRLNDDQMDELDCGDVFGQRAMVSHWAYEITNRKAGVCA